MQACSFKKVPSWYNVRIEEISELLREEQSTSENDAQQAPMKKKTNAKNLPFTSIILPNIKVI